MTGSQAAAVPPSEAAEETNPKLSAENEQLLEQLQANFKLAPRVGYTGGGTTFSGAAIAAVGGIGGGKKYQGATFLGVIATKPVDSAEDFHGKEFSGMDIFLLCPLSPGTATAPYTYSKGSKMDAKSIQAVNKNGQPLTAWADPNNASMRFWTWAKVGFNRGARNEKVTWAYSGGDTFTFWVETKDVEERIVEGDKSLGFSLYMDGKKPSMPIRDMDLVRVCIMPKSSEALSKPKKTCFAFKGIAPCSRTLVSYLPLLKDADILPRSLSEATQKAESTIRQSKVCV